jgi:hypothetical protein
VVLASRLYIYVCVFIYIYIYIHVYVFLTDRRVLCSEIWGSQGGFTMKITDFSEVFFLLFFIQRSLVAFLPSCVSLPGRQTFFFN